MLGPFHTFVTEKDFTNQHFLSEMGVLGDVRPPCLYSFVNSLTWFLMLLSTRHHLADFDDLRFQKGSCCIPFSQMLRFCYEEKGAEIES